MNYDVPEDYWSEYTSEQRAKWLTKPYQERELIIQESYLPMITDENKDIDKYKLIGIILQLQERIEDLENTCQRNDSYYD
jgi:hypothetical protein